MTPRSLLSISNHPQWGTGFPGEGHQGGSCQVGTRLSPGPNTRRLVPAPSSWGALPVSAVTPPAPTHAIRPRDGSRPTGRIHPLLPHRISHMAAAGTGRGRGGGAARTVSPAELSPEINPPARARGGASRAEMPASQPPRHRHPHRHVPSPGTVTSHRDLDTLGWAGGGPPPQQLRSPRQPLPIRPVLSSPCTVNRAPPAPEAGRRKRRGSGG